jgi:dUTP pyrophosphatase
MISLFLVSAFTVFLVILLLSNSELKGRLEYIERSSGLDTYLGLVDKIAELEAYTENLKEYVLAEEILPLKVKLLHPDAKLPSYAKEGDSGMDISALQDCTVAPGSTILVKTGLALGIPKGYEIQVRPRSGVSLKTMLRVSNSPGTVDQGFTGEVCVIITNFGTTEVVIEKGYRIAQIVLAKVAKAELRVVDDLEDTDRGDGGWGSTGTK